MDSHDQEMANYPDLPAVTALSQMENIKRILEQNLAEVNRSIARGFEEMKQDLTMVSTQITTSITHINTVPDRNSSGGLLRAGFQNARQAILGGGTTPEEQEQEVDRLKKEIETLHETHKRLGEDKDRSKRDKERYLRDIQELQIQLYNANLTSGRIGELESELDSMRLQNKQLSENCSRFRNMIIGKGADDTESITDSSITTSFIDLRAQIQRIVFKYYKVDKKDSSIKLLVDATKKQREFFMAFNDCSTGTQMMNRVRSKIFELVADEFLCTPCFGLDGVRPFGEVENGLKMFETELGKNKKGHEADIAEWRTRTMKCAKWLRSESSRPKNVAERIFDFMLPALVHRHRKDKASSKKIEDDVFDLILKLCTTAFNLALILRSCKDDYRCEFPEPRTELNLDESEPQDSEEAKPKRLETNFVAFTLSGALVKYPELNPEERLVLEKSHVVIMK